MMQSLKTAIFLFALAATLVVLAILIRSTDFSNIEINLNMKHSGYIEER